MIRIAGVNKESIVDGPGMRVTIFISGCYHNCKNCHNQEAQSFQFGEPLTESIIEDIMDSIDSPMISGVTFSGGDPIYSAKEVLELLRKIKERFPDKNIWLYTGFTWEEIDKLGGYAKELAHAVDVVVDGQFVESLKDYSQSFRGSTNQRFIDVKQTLQEGEIAEISED